MTQAVVARKQGDDFQARLFWLYAAQLLDPVGNVARWRTPQREIRKDARN
jgi:hypothetical protein